MHLSEKKNNQNFSYFLVLLTLLIPFAQISGPFFTDFIISLAALSYFFVIIIFNRKFHYHNKFLNILLIFWLFNLISSIFSEYKYLTLKPSITFFRFILFSFAFLFIIYNYKTFLEKLNISIIIAISLLIFDGYFQFIFGVNIVGFEKLRPDRVSSFFHDELILGSFLSKFLPIILFFYYENIKFSKLKKLNSIILVFLIPLIFLSGERAAFFMSILYCLIVMPYIFSLKKFISAVILFLIFGLVMIKSNNIIYDRYISQLKEHLVIKNKMKQFIFQNI